MMDMANRQAFLKEVGQRGGEGVGEGGNGEDLNFLGGSHLYSLPPSDSPQPTLKVSHPS